MRPKPYIGITGITASAESRAMLFDNLNPPEGTLTMIGVLASSKTLEGKPEDHPKRHADPKSMSSLFLNHQDALNLIHLHVDNPTHSNLYAAMSIARDLGGDNFHGLQLNIPWPDTKAIRSWKQRQGDERKSLIVLQCSRLAIDFTEDEPQGLVERLRRYDGLADYVLLDASRGRNEPFEPMIFMRYLSALYESDLNMNFGVAGGITGSNASRLLDVIFKNHIDTCTDAEGGIRTPGDSLDIKLARTYRREVLRSRQKARQSGKPTE